MRVRLALETHYSLPPPAGHAARVPVRAPSPPPTPCVQHSHHQQLHPRDQITTRSPCPGQQVHPGGLPRLARRAGCPSTCPVCRRQCLPPLVVTPTAAGGHTVTADERKLHNCSAAEGSRPGEKAPWRPPRRPPPRAGVAGARSLLVCRAWWPRAGVGTAAGVSAQAACRVGRPPPPVVGSRDGAGTISGGSE